MLSKMSAQQGGGSGSGGGGGGGGRRIPLSLSGTTGTGSSGGMSNVQQHGNNGNPKYTHERRDLAAATPMVSMASGNKELKKPQNHRMDSKNHGNAGSAEKDKEKKQNGTEGNANANAAAAAVGTKPLDKQTKEPSHSNSNKMDTNGDRKLEKKIKIDMRRDMKMLGQRGDDKKEEKVKERVDTPVDKPETKTKKSEVVNIDLQQQKDNNAKSAVEAFSQQQPQQQQQTNNDKVKEISNNLQPIQGTPERRGRSKMLPTQKPGTPTSNKPAEQASVIDNVIMNTISVDASPIKATTAAAANVATVPSPKPTKVAIGLPLPAAEPAPIIEATATAVATAVSTPAATSTPGRVFAYKPKAVEPQVSNKQEQPQPSSVGCSSPEREEYTPRNFSQISGRRSIRQTDANTSSRFEKNSLYRESYRRINTELDVTSNTNTSLNVTVGSEIPSNSFSFSYFLRGRKRERTPLTAGNSNTQSTTDSTETAESELSPPKRARLDKMGFFSGLINSPLTALRFAFNRTTIQTPTKSRLEQTQPGNKCDVLNLSGVDIEEEVANDLSTSGSQEDVTNAEIANETNQDANGNPDAEEEDFAADEEPTPMENLNCSQEMSLNDDSDIQITETLAADAKKHNRCNIM